MSTDDGATQVHKPPGDNCCGKGKQHTFQWVWRNGEMTADKQCIACGEVRTVDFSKRAE